MLRKSISAVFCAALVTCLSSTAFAGDNDFELSRFAEFDPNEYGPGCTNACGSVVPNEELFRSLVGQAGQVFAPRLASPAETLGEAGFAFNAMASFSLIDDEQEHWTTAIRDRDPDPALFSGHVQIRKGLPFSFEVAGNMGYLFDSEMFTLGADLKWALNEGFFYFPDLAFRGSVNTLMGSRDLQLVVAGGDMSISKAFGIGGIMVVTPYLGYQMLWSIGSSRLLNAYPQDPRPPQFDSDTPTGQGSSTFAPEFVFGTETVQVNRPFVGARLNVWVLNFVVEGVFAEVTQLTFSGGVDF